MLTTQELQSLLMGSSFDVLSEVVPTPDENAKIYTQAINTFLKRTDRLMSTQLRLLHAGRGFIGATELDAARNQLKYDMLENDRTLRSFEASLRQAGFGLLVRDPLDQTLTVHGLSYVISRPGYPNHSESRPGCYTVGLVSGENIEQYPYIQISASKLATLHLLVSVDFTS